MSRPISRVSGRRRGTFFLITFGLLLLAVLVFGVAAEAPAPSPGGPTPAPAAAGAVKQGIWSSVAELAQAPMAGPGWEAVLRAAESADPKLATVSNQDSNNNVAMLAAGIAYARTGDKKYRERVIAAVEKLAAAGKPADRTLAWGRETGAYAMAADLIGYHSPQFEAWLKNMAEVYTGEDGRTLIGMFRERPNNWGTQAFISLAAIYAYLGDTKSLAGIRDYWIKMVTGPNPGAIYGDDLSWHLDPKNPRLINPKGAAKEGMDIDGFVPDDMRRGGPFKNPPVLTGYAWETLQGMVAGARVLERQGMPIWDVDDKALYRAAYAVQVRLGKKEPGWKAEGDDLWMLPILDKAYGTSWSGNQGVWGSGKCAGWAYVLLGEK